MSKMRTKKQIVKELKVADMVLEEAKNSEIDLQGDFLGMIGYKRA